MTAEKAREALGFVLPEGIGARVGRTFEFMDIAERLIREAGGRESKKVHEAFRYLQPTEWLRDFGDDLYTAHAREIIERCRKGSDPSPATDAECLGCMSIMSQVAPLQAGAAHAMTVLFRRCLPNRPMEDAGAEAWAGQAEEIIADVRKQASKAIKRDCREGEPA